MSVSSFDGSPVPLDLPVKYQKLATEYAKLRAQVGVLKTAVLDEQTRNTDLKDNLRVKDQNLRKAEQELDSLNFRNEQLTRRVTVLQDELDQLQNSSRKGKGKSYPQNINNPILEEELQKKISENARLALTLQEQTERYEQEKFILIQQNEAFEHELKECKKALSILEQAKVSSNENENKIILQKLQNKREELNKVYKELKMLKLLASNKEGLNSQVKLKDNTYQIIKNLPFNNILKAFSDFYKNIQKYWKLCYEDSDNFSQFNLYFERNEIFLIDFQNVFTSFTQHSNCEEIAIHLPDVVAAIDKYVINLEELASMDNLRADLEFVRISKDIILSIKKHWMQLRSVLQVFCTSNFSATDNEDFINSLTEVFRSVRSTCDYFSSALNDKMSSKQANRELETATVSSLSRLGSHSSSVFKKLNENANMLRETLESQSPACLILQDTCVEENSSPVEKSHDVNETQQQQSEYWRQEYDLLKLSFTKRVKELEEQISSQNGTLKNSAGDSLVTSNQKIDEPVEIKNMFGTLRGPWPNAVELESQESEVKKYFTSRANTLVSERQLAESKLTSWKEECSKLQKRLEHSLESSTVLEASIQQAQNTVSRLQEELSTTSSSYEEQLSSMSEHMANMNMRLTEQQEQIEQLSYQLNTKDSKRGKGK